MKRYLSFLSVLCTLTLSSVQAQQAWHWQNPLPQGNDLEGVHSFSQTTAIAVGSNGTIIKTSDGGCCWDIKNSGTDEWLRDVFFVDDQNGWVAGNNGIILRTTDGGETWIIQNSNPTYTLYSIHFLNITTGWAVGTFGKILKTTDGGSNWITTSFGSNVFSSVFFADESNGWICGWFGSILKTTNGGSSWTPVAVSAIDNFYSLSFSDNLTGVAVGTGYIARTSDGGATWDLVQNAPSLNSVYLLSSGKGWAVGLGRAYAYTDNGGLSWVYEPGNGGYNHLEAVSAADEYSVWMVGEFGDIFKSTGGFFYLEPVSTGTTDYIRDICFVDQNIGWVAGGRANPFEVPTIHKTTNGGIHWIPITLPQDNTLFGIDFVNENTGWAVGAEGLIFKTSDGGSNWSTYLTNNQTWLNDVFFINENTGWVVGSTRALYKTTDAGNTWNAKNSGTVASLWSVFFINENTGWVVGTGGTILKTVNGGEDWENQESGYSTGTWLQDVFFIDENKGWIAGVSGRLLKTENGGNSWTALVVPPSSTYYYSSILFIDESRGWACGSPGTILKTTDGGMTWLQENTIAQYGLNSVFFTDANTGWVAGDGGVILKYGEQIKTGNLSHNALNMSITDFNTTEDVIFAFYQKEYLDYYKLAELEVMLDTILHTSDSDLIITLSHSGITDTLVNRRGGDGDNFFSSRLFDAATNPISSGNAPFTGDFKPESPLRSFLGLDPNGEWKLSIYDGSAGNTGILQAWGLKLYFAGITGAENEPESYRRDFILNQNYPNPFNKYTTISWLQPADAHIILKVYDLTGREVKTLMDCEMAEGNHQVTFDGSYLPEGVYFVRVTTSNILLTKKIVKL
jgi:photosystem II stability/assembly factor-like uncharacterized protein